MRLHPVKVPLKVFSILFKIHSACCVREPVLVFIYYSINLILNFLFRLIPSTSDVSDGEISVTPVPAPPPGYESRDPGFAPITDADTQLLPPSSSNTSKKSHQDNIQCSTTMTTTNDLESRL